jgi:hypothetical protein
MRTFVAILCAAFAGLAVIGAMSSVASHDSGDAMFLGLLGGAAAMGAALAFRRPTEAERLARQAKRDARREARLARRRQADPDLWKKLKLLPHDRIGTSQRSQKYIRFRLLFRKHRKSLHQIFDKFCRHGGLTPVGFMIRRARAARSEPRPSFSGGTWGSTITRSIAKLRLRSCLTF